MKWSVGSKIGSMNVVAILMIFIISLSCYYAFDRMLTAVEWRQHSFEVIIRIEDLLAVLEDAETGQRGYLITRQARFLEPYNAAMKSIPEEFNALKSLTMDNPQHQQSLNSISSLIAEKLANIQSSFKITDPAQQQALMSSGKQIMDDIRLFANEMKVNEGKLLEQRIDSANAGMYDMFYVIIFGAIFATLFLVIVGVVLTRKIAKPLREMTNTAVKISRGELDQFSPVNNTDEVGILSQSFARMTQSLRELAQAAKSVSNGDLSVNVVPQSDKDMLGNAIALMIKNLNQLAQAAKIVSSGDLTVNVTPQSEKDILGNAIAKLITNLRMYTMENQEVVKLLNTSVNEIYTSVSQLVASGSETAVAVNETTSTIEEVRQTSQVSNQKAKSVADTAQLVADISRNGKKSIEETNLGMMGIRNQMQAIAECMLLLSEQTQGINGIIETVDDLAQQSNLLSVNASIEAEKAGDQGKGFRIVAQEIKSLADQSKQSTHKVREILQEVQKATSTAVMATEQGNKAADGGVVKSEESGSAIEKLSNSVIEAAQAAIQIAASCQQQLIGMEQAAAAMENIKQASTQNVDSAKQLEESAHNLREIGGKLQELVKKYQVSTEQGSGAL